MLNVKALFTKMLNTPVVKVVTASKSTGNVSAGGFWTLNITPPQVDGYEPVACGGIGIEGSGSSYLYLSGFGFVEGVGTAYGRNQHTSAHTGTVVFYFLYRRLGGVLSNIVSTIAHFLERGCAVC